MSKKKKDNEDKKDVVFAIGDVNGCYEALWSMMQEIGAYTQGDIDKAEIVLLGNYVDYGPQTKQTIGYVKKLIEQDGVIALKGGRDYVMYKSSPNYFKSPAAAPTITSYRGSSTQYIYAKHNRIEVKEFIRDRKFLGSLPCFYETKKFFFCSSGVDPTRALIDQTKGAVMFITSKFHNSTRVYDKKIVHGNKPVRKVDLRHNRVNVDTNCWKTGVLSCAVLSNTTGNVLDILSVEDKKIQRNK